MEKASINRAITKATRLQGNFFDDLNACHEMEKVLDRAKDLCPGMEVPLTQYDQYWGALTEVTKGDIIHATARQRCIAFLRTIGQYEEDK